MSWLDDITDSVDMYLGEHCPGDSEGQGSLACSMGLQRVRHDLVIGQ